MTDRMVVSRKTLEEALKDSSMGRYTAVAIVLREIIDTAEEFPPVDKADIEPAESAWITDRPPTVEELGEGVNDIAPVTVKRDGDVHTEAWIGQRIRESWYTLDNPRFTYVVIAWQQLPAPYVPPTPKRLCWCGAEMEVVAHNSMKGFLVTCSANRAGQHGTGPIAATSAKAWTDYDKLVGR